MSSKKLQKEKTIQEIIRLQRPFFTEPTFVAVVLGFLGIITAQINGCYDREKRSLKEQITEIDSKLELSKHEYEELQDKKEILNMDVLELQLEIDDFSRLNNNNNEIKEITLKIIKEFAKNDLLSAKNLDFLTSLSTQLSKQKDSSQVERNM